TPNTHAIAIDGSFDDCQNMVKAMFAHHNFRDTVHLSAVNSINWGRIMAQVVYYFTAAASLGAPGRAVSFTVPTGNFGDIYAGFVARQMGLPIEKLVIATNENDILCRAVKRGRYEMQAVKATITPSMDIQISSNFERLLFDASGRQATVVTALMSGLQQSSAYTLPEKLQKFISGQFMAGSATEPETREMMHRMQTKNGYLPDPHTAVALHVAQKHLTGDAAMVTLSTAHPCKFPDTVKNATGIDPILPVWAGGLLEATEKYEVLPNDQTAVESFILSETGLK
ncbi:MAG: threonine synthase, partial [Rhodobacteraceae bacterium]|nr:threonine synthase [Paracoccaceae bacterium]